ncbi:unnamed protein product [Paramecium sonneborni]|uniref:Uncharacterized protein n=1 Tax=Paramecium sonneborni TaxID=65129 RepID=A0A8S1MSA8_9CILI|nr:unnamed protein product [Paramecium sonneborni]
MLCLYFIQHIEENSKIIFTYRNGFVIIIIYSLRSTKKANRNCNGEQKQMVINQMQLELKLILLINKPSPLKCQAVTSGFECLFVSGQTDLDHAKFQHIILHV